VTSGVQDVYPNIGCNNKYDSIRVVKSNDLDIIFFLKKANMYESPFHHRYGLGFSLVEKANTSFQLPFFYSDIDDQVW